MLTLEKLLAYEEKYKIFGEFREEGLALAPLYLPGGEKADECASLAKTLSEMQYATEVRTFPHPDDPALRFFAVMENLELGRSRYLKRGFTEEETDSMLGVFGRSLGSARAKTGRFGYNILYFWWVMLYITTEVFNYDGLQLETRVYRNKVTWIRNLRTKEIKPLVMSGTVHRSGHILGSEGCEDKEGSYPVAYFETEDAFYGADIRNDLIPPTVSEFKKTEWEAFLRPGEPVIAFHFPRSADISAAHLNRFYKEGLRIVRNYYPEFKAKCYFCSSWLLDCKLRDILKPTSNIIGFQNLMATCPMKSAGDSVFGYVFPPHPESYESLPENTSLERGLKKIYLSGEKIYGVLGVRPFDLCE